MTKPLCAYCGEKMTGKHSAGSIFEFGSLKLGWHLNEKNVAEGCDQVDPLYKIFNSSFPSAGDATLLKTADEINARGAGRVIKRGRI